MFHVLVPYGSELQQSRRLETIAVTSHCLISGNDFSDVSKSSDVIAHCLARNVNVLTEAQRVINRDTKVPDVIGS
jgi:hypothetical protein